MSLQQHLADAQRLFAAGQFELARDAARAALKLQRDHPGALHALGASLTRLGQPAEGRRTLRRVSKILGNSPRFHFDLSYTYQAEGKLDRALETLQRGMRDCPEDAFLLRAAAEILRMMRRYDDAHDLLRPLIDAGATEPDLLIAFAAACARAKRPQDAIDLVEPRLARATMPDRDRMHALFSLGDCHEKVGDYPGAFACYADANRLKHARFDPEAHARAIDQVIAGWTPEAVASLPRPDADTSRAVFVVGMPRSGTSLVEQILSIHPDVAAGGELNRFHYICAPTVDAQGDGSPYVHDTRVLDQPAVDRIAREFLEVLRAVDPKSRYVTDKVPLNAIRLGEVAAALPDARVIHCIRDPVDTCLSCFAHDFGGSLPWAYDLAHLGAFFADYERLMAHWKRVLPLPILDVVYEDLVSDQEPGTRRLLEFLDLQWHEDCLRPHESGRVILTASMDQVRRPVYTTAIGRAERFGPALDPLRDALRDKRRAPIPDEGRPAS